MKKAIISIKHQTLDLYDETDNLIFNTLVSTSKNGIGEKNGSFCTPSGLHKIRAKIGTNAPINSVFVGRRLTGEIYEKQMKKIYPQRDWILTRILWLSGLEIGKNRLGDIDTMRRYIYIHGCPDDVIVGQPGSIGCIRMHNRQIIDFFEIINIGDLVKIS